MSGNSVYETIVLGGGCFWCIEAVFLRVKGVISVVSGYAGGAEENPTYEQVCGGKTGHAEVIKIEFDPKIVTLEDILRVFFTVHDPTTINRQGSDVGRQYRSMILYSREEQSVVAERIMLEIEAAEIYAGKIVTEMKPLDKFYPAEEYHQRYFEKNTEASYCQFVIAPKVARFRQQFGHLYAS